MEELFLLGGITSENFFVLCATWHRIKLCCVRASITKASFFQTKRGAAELYETTLS